MPELRRVFPAPSRSIRATPSSPDSGLTLVELVVAMMVFAILALGVAYSMLATLQSSRDNRGRQVAANLAAQEIDLVRSVDDIFSIQNATRVQEVDGVPYTVSRSTGWVNSGIASSDCGSGDGVLQHKRINVAVSWGVGGAARTVRSDTVVAPGSKINDPTLGTITVQVTRADGTGAPGIAVTVKPSSTPEGAESPTEPIPVTDLSGCTYALKIKPGNYDVTIAKDGYVTSAHAAVETQKDRRVTQGSATAVSFSYDLAVDFAPTFIHGAGGSVTAPEALDLSFSSTAGTVTTTVGSVRPKLFPSDSGYTVLAGKISEVSGGGIACDAIDPARWPDTTAADGAAVSGFVVPPTSAAPGTSTTASVPVAVVKLTMPAGSTATVTARSVSASEDTPSGDAPGCDTSMTYVLGSISGEKQFVMPFGVWSFTTSSGTVGVMPGTSAVPVTGGSSTNGLVILDPRRPVVTP
ncbi:prepilin-type N-terminal cleavage/methylation domain-containing protein [Labedella populi]|uniref:Prepilin-type N-terminal cleavage/methylation domain-containing protein n=1 Tax=Labedella populi TaxID=2498850 RepID=A0A444QCC9_9MICO|nr:prepilin-type N-terminal cleavage/methylation domain-containing protein [Labedella populi]RWZ64298.1 prepilin-type N-terminal cleavage/methylation domain-containing protein [Labedella populi]